MVGLPYDDLKKWRSVYPADVWISQMDKAAEGFGRGVEILEQALQKVDGEHRAKLENLYRRAEMVRIHLQSSAEQGRFVESRNNYYFARNNAVRKENIDIMRKACIAQRALITRALSIVECDSSIGYESSNHYFYLPIDLVESYLSTLYIEEWLNSESSQMN